MSQTIVLTECAMHPRGEYRECHHVGNRYVAVYWGEGAIGGGEGWIARSGFTDRPGSMSSWAETELDYMLERLRQ